MVVETSALLAILQNEPERGAFNRAIENADACLLSTAAFVETSIVLEARYGADGLRYLDFFLNQANIHLVPVDRDQALIARQAFSRFGKGRHPAALNFGDCFSYALAKARGEVLLYKGDDFAKTDLPPASAI